MSSIHPSSLLADTAGDAPTCAVALKEWAAILEVLKTGEQSLLFRKGGIRESAGFFLPEHGRFLLFPTSQHQNKQDLRPPFHPLLAQAPPPTDSVTFTCYAEVSDAYPAREYRLLKRLDDLHIYTPLFLQKRLTYRPSQPLYLMLLRVFRIQPRTVPFHADYAGCHSWVLLHEALPLRGARPVLPDEAFASLKSRLDRLFRRGEGRPG